MASVCADDDAARLAEAELELALRRARRLHTDLEVAACTELDALLEHLELALGPDAAVQRDAPAAVGRAHAAPERDRRAAAASHEDRQLVLVVDARLGVAVRETQARLESARGAVVHQG